MRLISVSVWARKEPNPNEYATSRSAGEFRKVGKTKRGSLQI